MVLEVQPIVKGHSQVVVCRCKSYIFFKSSLPIYSRPLIISLAMVLVANATVFFFLVTVWPVREIDNGVIGVVLNLEASQIVAHVINI